VRSAKTATIVAYNLMGEALRNALDPRTR